CATASDCIAVGPTIGTAAVSLTTTNGGSAWAVGSSPPGSQNPEDVTCPGTTACVAVGSSGADPAEDTTTTAGQTWVAGVSK
ncbi:MAG: hypothetical protein ACLP2J_10390, partial [Acidimicrobiales bacterium]